MTKKKTNSRKISAKKSCNWKGKYEEKEAECNELFNRNFALKAKAEQYDLVVNTLANRVVEKLKEDDDWVRDIACEEAENACSNLSIN